MLNYAAVSKLRVVLQSLLAIFFEFDNQIDNNRSNQNREKEKKICREQFEKVVMGSQEIISMFQFPLSSLLHRSLSTPPCTRARGRKGRWAFVLVLQGLMVAFGKRHSRFVNEARLDEGYEKGEKFHSYSVVLN